MEEYARRFFLKVDKDGPLPDQRNRHYAGLDQCWIWTASTDDHGYGFFRFRRECWNASRVSWILHRGEIDNGACVLHKCDNPSCVNPGHLFLGTQIDNIRDMYTKDRGRFPKTKTLTAPCPKP